MDCQPQVDHQTGCGPSFYLRDADQDVQRESRTRPVALRFFAKPLYPKGVSSPEN